VSGASPPLRSPAPPRSASAQPADVPSPAVRQYPGWPLGAARIIIGVLWFQQLLWKLPPDFGCGPAGDQGLCDWIGREIQSPAIPAYAGFLRDLVLPNLGLFGWLVFFTEAAIAGSLLFGVLTRFGGLLGFAQATNLLIGLAAVPHEWYWTYAMLALFCLLFALTGAGRWLGLDGALLPRLRAATAGRGVLGRLLRLA
jgi:thiosulfate dehydrogenase [quinone] large subunit